MIPVLFSTIILYSTIFAIPLIFVIYLTNCISRINNMLSNKEEKNNLRRSERLIEKRLKKSSSENLIN